MLNNSSWVHGIELREIKIKDLKSNVKSEVKAIIPKNKVNKAKNFMELHYHTRDKNSLQITD